AKELIAGFWLIQVKSKEEAIEWVKRVPAQEAEIEIRQLFEASDFPEAAREEELREEMQTNVAKR
ncbi:MAG: YciI family protein, partial [Vicinamibacteria bacterium]